MGMTLPDTAENDYLSIPTMFTVCVVDTDNSVGAMIRGALQLQGARGRKAHPLRI
jgi:hypothetical protein